MTHKVTILRCAQKELAILPDEAYGRVRTFIHQKAHLCRLRGEWHEGRVLQ